MLRQLILQTPLLVNRLYNRLESLTMVPFHDKATAEPITFGGETMALRFGFSKSLLNLYVFGMLE
jgi:hypothetical protein